MTQDPFDALLSNALSPPDRAVDQAFVNRTQTAISEAERFRRWRRLALRKIGSETLFLAGLSGAAITCAQIPGIGEVLGDAPLGVPAIVGMVLLAWLALGQQRGARTLV
jgi:hypothetical protein